MIQQHHKNLQLASEALAIHQLGVEIQASGDESTAWGSLTEASATRSTAWGSSTEATGVNATAWGRQVSAKSYLETGLGRYNTDYTPNSTTSWNANDRLFGIGNGTSLFNRSDAMVVLKNGKTGIGISNPQHRLGCICITMSLT